MSKIRRRLLAQDQVSGLQRGRRERPMDVHFSSKKQDYTTPDFLFQALDAEFRITVDVCATPENAKCKKYYCPEDNGLIQPWAPEVCFCNPPYRQTGKWIEKAFLEVLRGATVILLVPARTDTIYWHKWAWYFEIRFFNGRLKFGNEPNSAPFPSAVLVGRPPKFSSPGYGLIQQTAHARTAQGMERAILRAA